MNILYYESHITIEPTDENGREKIEKIIRPFSFKLAKLLMQKRSVDTPERSKYDTFCTGHGAEEKDIVYRMKQCVISLKMQGFKVWRYKIECVTIDSRNEDIFNLLKD
jgi:hypothetical protein